ncbi:RNA-directed DNA polymerase (Reverse transcriptase), Ribonuclease H [Gossypium australe]|uniref:RNA-directed DNA polymerase (Reverse transcriptase), Ribonuclease H n=1 Tax=Gossypium australe TaxID=47621 RepID=A0A5B6VPP4_9ROSI|nr:RNA-directed DNA polymerase (Reverse transcriptase), Ribonuclease H [Gossypium australe]
MFSRGMPRLLRRMDVVKAKEILEEANHEVRVLLVYHGRGSYQLCHKCQIYQDKIQAPPSFLHRLSLCGGWTLLGRSRQKLLTDIVIFMVVDYFTKWVKVTSYANVTKSTTPYHPKMNGAKKIMRKMTVTCKYWHKKSPFTLYAHRTLAKTFARVVPFSL